MAMRDSVDRVGIDDARVPRAEAPPKGPVPDTLSPASRRDYLLRRALAAGDFAALALAIGGTALLQSALGRSPEPWAMGISAALLPLWLPIGISARLYPMAGRGDITGFADEIGPVLRAATIWSWVVLMTRVALESGYVLLLPSLGLWGLSIASVLILRAAVRAVARTRPWYSQRTLVVGDDEDALRVMSRISRHPEWGIEVVAQANLQGSPPSVQRFGAFPGAGGERRYVADASNGAYDVDLETMPDPQAVATVDSQAQTLLDWVGTAGVARVVFATHPSELRHRTTLARVLTAAGVQVDLVPGDSDIVTSNAEVHHFEGLPVISLLPTSLPRTFGFVKRGFDLAVSVPVLLLASPLLLYCAAKIKLDSEGPVLFRQDRVGLRRRRFQLLKLRSMVADADQRLDEVADLTLHGNGLDSGMLKVADDPRVTKFGVWLRRWSIDELPQLINVVKGEMSLVGPRPLPVAEDARVGKDFEARYEVRPGITGRWQVLGRSDIPLDDMVRLDYTYVMNWSLFEDVKLLLRTISAVTRRRGAY